MNRFSSKLHLPQILVFAATAGLLAFAPVQSDAQLSLVRFEGAFDLADDDPQPVVNAYKFAATGHEPRTFSITHVTAEAQPQFLPVTNVQGDPADIAKFFGAKPRQKVAVTAMVGGGGGRLTLTTVTLRPISAPAGDN